MKNLKKVLALVMAFAMAFTMMAGAAYTDQDDIQATDAVELLATLNVMTGKGDGMFHPNDTITRAEICRIIYTIRNEGNDNANAYADMQTSFQDLTSADDWAKGYIKHCQSVGLISGRNEAGTVFGPQDPVTGVELAVICLRVLGYDPAKAGIGGESWSTKTIGLASEAGLLKGVNMESVTGPCERQWAAQIMANMLDARTVTWSTDSDSYSKYGDNNALNSTVGKEYMKLHTSVGTLVSVSGGNLDIIRSASDIADSDGTQTSFTNVDKDYAELLGQKVKVLYYDGKANSVIGVYPLSGNTVYTVNATAVESDGDKVKFDGKSYAIEYIDTTTSSSGVVSTNRTNNRINVAYVNIDGSEYNNSNFTAQTGIAYTVASNGADSKLFDNWDASSAVMKFVDSDTNGRLDSVIITDYAAAEVTSATSTKVVAGKSYNFSDENIDEDIKQGDWVSISYNRFDDCKDIKKLEVTTGKLDGLKKDSQPKDKGYKFNEYRVDSVWFNNANDKDGRTDVSTVKAGDSIEYILVNGVAWKVKRAGAGSLDDVVDVAMVVNKEVGIGGKQVKLQFFNDTTAVVSVDDKSTIKYGGLAVGSVYEYSVSGGKYSFENLDKTKDFYGDYTYVNQSSYTIGNANISGVAIDDKAKVILFQNNGKDSGNDSDVITGKQLKALKSSDVGVASASAYYFTADVSGLTRAAALAMTVSKLPETTSTNDFYGYILSDAIFSSGNNEVSYDLLLESGETVTVYERSVQPAGRKENTLIGYKSLAAEDSNGKRYIDEVEVYHVDVDNNFGIGAITSVNSNQSTVVIDGYGKDKNGVSGARVYDRDITSDTVIFYVDTDAKTGSNTGSISKAIDYTDQEDCAIITTSDGDKKVANCLYLAKDDEDLEVLVVDTADRQFRGEEVDRYNDKTSAVAWSLSQPTTELTQGTAGSVTFTAVPKNFKFSTSGTPAVNNNIAANITVTGGLAASPATFNFNANDGSHTFTVATTNATPAGVYTVTVAARSNGDSADTKATATFTVKSGAAITDAYGFGSSFWKDTALKAGDIPSVNVSVTPVAGINADMKVLVNGVASDAKLNAGDKVEVVVTVTAKDGYTLGDITAPTLTGFTSSIDQATKTVTYTATVPTVLDNANAQDLANAFAITPAGGTVTADTVSGNITVPADKTLNVTNSIDAGAKLTGGGTVKAANNIPTAAVVAKQKFGTKTEIDMPIADSVNVTADSAISGNVTVANGSSFLFESDIDYEISTKNADIHFQDATSARIVHVLLPNAIASAGYGCVKIVAVNAAGTEKRSAADTTNKAECEWLLTIDNKTVKTIFEFYTAAGGTGTPAATYTINY
jgi:hypothetical protein